MAMLNYQRLSFQVTVGALQHFLVEKMHALSWSCGLQDGIRMYMYYPVSDTLTLDCCCQTMDWWSSL